MKIKLKLKASVLLFFLLAGCNTSKITQSAPDIPSAIVLYASDTPNEFYYFSTFFSERINKEKIFRARHDHKINEIWLANALHKKQSVNVENEIKRMKETLQYHYKNKSYDKLASSNLKFENRFYTILSNNPIHIKPHLLIEFFFWSAVAELKGNQKTKNSLIFYQKNASLSEKNLLESEVDLQTFKDLQTNSHQSQKTISILSKSPCLIYVNGNLITQGSVTLPIQLKSVVSASCPEGNFSQIFIPMSTSSILIDRFSMPTQIDMMPPLENLPKNLVQQENVEYLLLIYWSKKLHFLEAKLLETKQFTELKKISLKLQTNKDFDEAENKLILFLRK